MIIKKTSKFQYYRSYKNKYTVANMSSSILFPTNEYAVSSKSFEEIQRLTMPLFTHISEALTHIVTKGLPAQLPFVYKHVHQAHTQTLQIVCSKAPTESAENQIIIAVSLRELLKQKGELLEQTQLEMILSTCLECLNNLQSTANKEMVKLLQATLGVRLGNRKLIRRLEEVALDLGKSSQPIISKVTSGRLISILACYQGRTIKGQMIDIIKRVLSDSEVEVKKVWVSEIFPRLLRNLELEFIELHLQEKIYEAVWDENEEIAALALQTILKNARRFSVEEQSSRIVKLFIDSLTSKRQKIAVLASEMLGSAFQKLLNSILGNEQFCLRFWKSLIQLTQSKNQTILNNLAYNLPGVLSLSSPLYKIDPLCDVYIELFYQPSSNKILLATYFHQVAVLFPSKGTQLKQLAYWMLGELFEEEDPCDQAIRIVNKLLHKLPMCKSIFLEGEGPEKYFEAAFCEYVMNYYTLIQNHNNSRWISELHIAFRDCYDCFSTQFVESTLLAKLYLGLRNKPANPELLVEAVVRIVTRDGSSALINAYSSKISVELSKSSKSYERQTALNFFYYATYYCSIELFQEYRLGQKYLAFNTDKNFKVKTTFIKYLPRMLYFLTKQEKIEYAIILSRLVKDTDYQIQTMMAGIVFVEEDQTKKSILEHSKVLKQKEREKAIVLNVKKQNMNRRSSKELKKEEVLKKRIETTKSKTKILIKDIPKKKVAPVLVKTSNHLNFRKNS